MAVLTMSPQADGKLIIGGDFTSVGGSPRHYVARLNADGLLDTSFQPDIALTFGGVLAVQTEVDGNVLVGGDYTTVDGVSRVNLARLKPDGSLDPNFDTGTGPSMPGRRHPHPRVRCLASRAYGN